MKTIPRCPHCGKRVKTIIEKQEWIHQIGKYSEKFHEYGQTVYTLQPDPKGEYHYIAENQGKTFICSECGGNLGDHFGVMGSYNWIE